jgi:hypothetical protein
MARTAATSPRAFGNRATRRIIRVGEPFLRATRWKNEGSTAMIWLELPDFPSHATLFGLTDVRSLRERHRVHWPRVCSQPRLPFCRDQAPDDFGPSGDYSPIGSIMQKDSAVRFVRRCPETAAMWARVFGSRQHGRKRTPDGLRVMPPHSAIKPVAVIAQRWRSRGSPAVSTHANSASRKYRPTFIVTAKVKVAHPQALLVLWK